jgi:hypothetical protein
MDGARTSAIPIIDPGVATEAAAHTGRDYKASTPGLRSSLSMLVAAAVLAYWHRYYFRAPAAAGPDLYGACVAGDGIELRAALSR